MEPKQSVRLPSLGTGMSEADRARDSRRRQWQVGAGIGAARGIWARHCRRWRLNVFVVATGLHSYRNHAVLRDIRRLLANVACVQHLAQRRRRHPSPMAPSTTPGQPFIDTRIIRKLFRLQLQPIILTQSLLPTAPSPQTGALRRDHPSSYSSSTPVTDLTSFRISIWLV